MTKRFKLTILLICILFILPVLFISAFADETAEVYPTELTIMKGLNCKTLYTEGEEFSIQYFYGRIYYSDGTNEFLSTDKLDYLEKGPLTVDVTSITFIYEGVTYSLPITVEPSLVPIPVPLGIEVETEKTEFLATEKIDPSLFNVTLLYSDSTEKAIDITECSFYPSLDTALTSDITSISIIYTTSTTTFSASIPVTVLPILSIEPVGVENVRIYESAPLTSLPGVTLTAYYDEAKTISKVITEYTLASASDIIRPDENGQTLITITADSVSINAYITVIEITGYNVTGFNNAYYYGDICSTENVQVYAIYKNGATTNITDQIVFNVPEIIVAGSTITAYHNGFDLKDYIQVLLPEGEIMVITPPDKVKYEIGEVFDNTGLSVGVNYSDGTRKFLSAGEYTIEASETLTAADKFVTITYYGISANISISVGDEAYIVSLSIIGAPDVLSYYEGHTLNTSGLLIQATFSDGTSSIIDHRTLTFTPALNTPLTTDITSIKISANDGTDKYCEVLLPITVAKKVPTALIATSSPNKTVYAEGETFDPDGLSLCLIFNDMSTIVPSSFTFSPELGSAIVLLSNATEKYIIYAIYEYEGVEYSYPIEITVHPAEILNIIVSRTPAKITYDVGDKFNPEGLELLIIYKNTALAPAKVPTGYYSFSPSVIAKDTKEVTVTFRELTVTIPITVNGAETTPPETTEQPPVTTAPPEQTTTPPEVTSAEVTTEEPDVTTEIEVTEPEVTTEEETTLAPEDITTEDAESTSDQNEDDDKSPSSLLYLWIIVIGVIVVALIALIIYYKKNFT